MVDRINGVKFDTNRVPASSAETRNANKKLVKKHDKTYKKAQKTTADKIAKFKLRGGISGWDAVYGLLNTAK